MISKTLCTSVVSFLPCSYQFISHAFLYKPTLTKAHITLKGPS